MTYICDPSTGEVEVRVVEGQGHLALHTSWMGWREGSVVQSTRCSYRERRFDSHMGAFNCLYSYSPRQSDALFCPPQALARHVQIYMQIEDSYTMNKKINLKNK